VGKLPRSGLLEHGAQPRSLRSLDAAQKAAQRRLTLRSPFEEVFMFDFLQQHASDYIAGLAVILSAAANWRVVRAERTAKKAQKAMRRMDMLVEIERKNAVIGKLALVTAQKILLLQQHPNLVRSPEEEIGRLRNNLALLQEFKDSEEEQRRISEMADGGNDIELHGKALTDVQRLRVRMEADVEKETNTYKELLEVITKK
jgi:hypothetical protein